MKISFIEGIGNLLNNFRKNMDTEQKINIEKQNENTAELAMPKQKDDLSRQVNNDGDTFEMTPQAELKAEPEIQLEEEVAPEPQKALEPEAEEEVAPEPQKALEPEAEEEVAPEPQKALEPEAEEIERTSEKGFDTTA